jgi:hypothetical protein
MVYLPAEIPNLRRPAVKRTLFSRLISYCVACVVFVSFVSAQTLSQKPADPEREQIEKLVKQGWQEADEFVKAGGKESDANYPGKKWAATFWEYRTQHPGTAASAHATAEALHFLVHADQLGELRDKTDSLKPDDAAWQRIIGVLREAADKKKDYDYLIAKSGFLLEKSTDKEVRMRAQFALAQGFWKKGDADRAKMAFQKVVADYPNTPFAREADGNIHELDSLNLGQAAPLFAYRGLNGEPVALADFKGKVVLLNFWASW